MNDGPFPLQPAPPKDRLTVVETVYHQRWGENPISIESRFGRELTTHEQPYSRECVATEEWQPLDLGWLNTNVGQLVILNREGSLLQFQTYPTAEVREEMATRIIELTTGDDDPWFIPPGESHRGWPSKPENLRIRCQNGTARYTLHLIPR